MKLLSLFGLLMISNAAFAAEGYAPIKALKDAATILASASLQCETSADCEVLELGSRACGGAAGYVVTSKLNPNLAEARTLAQKSVSSEDLYNATHHIFSICSIELAPTPSCQQNACQ